MTGNLNGKNSNTTSQYTNDTKRTASRGKNGTNMKNKEKPFLEINC